eukprot:4588738-Prymnesium_polylepis.1
MRQSSSMSPVQRRCTCAKIGRRSDVRDARRNGGLPEPCSVQRVHPAHQEAHTHLLRWPQRFLIAPRADEVADGAVLLARLARCPRARGQCAKQPVRDRLAKHLQHKVLSGSCAAMAIAFLLFGPLLRSRLCNLQPIVRVADR